MLKEEEMREPRWWMLVRATITHKVWRRRRLTSWRDDQRTEKRRGTSYAPQNPFLICCSFDCQEAITIESSVACPALSYPVLFFIQSDDDDCLCDDDNKRLTCDEALASPLLCLLYQPPNCQSPSLPPQKHTHTQIHRGESGESGLIECADGRIVHHCCCRSITRATAESLSKERDAKRRLLFFFFYPLCLFVCLSSFIFCNPLRCEFFFPI